jgi:uncharacterized protein (UPF0248 family)
MPNPRDILNELKWKKNLDLYLAEIWYVHRGAPNDTKILTGSEIINLEKSFMQTTTSMIPYHRIIKIIYKDDIIFLRKKNKKYTIKK